MSRLWVYTINRDVDRDVSRLTVVAGDDDVKNAAAGVGGLLNMLDSAPYDASRSLTLTVAAPSGRSKRMLRSPCSHSER